MNRCSWKKTAVITTWKKVQEQNKHISVLVAEAYITVPELHIPEEASLEAKIQKLGTSMRDAKTKMAKVQLELILKITELELKSQPSSPPEVREHCVSIVKDGVHGGTYNYVRRS